jgi:hypothetical protein
MFSSILFGGIIGWICFMAVASCLYCGAFPEETFSGKSAQYLGSMSIYWAIIPGCVIGFILHLITGRDEDTILIKVGSFTWIIVTITAWISQSDILGLLSGWSVFGAVLYSIIVGAFAPIISKILSTTFFGGR